MPTVSALLKPCRRRSVGREVRVEVGLPDRAIVDLLLLPSILFQIGAYRSLFVLYPAESC
jgi:hypothetical protein